MRDVDDPHFVELLKEYPGFPVEFVQHLNRLDRQIEEMKYRVKEISWEKETLREKRAKLVAKAVAEIKKINPPEKKHGK